ncbi:hypothetical protein F5Y06DRAFT_168904 [Hypoxylon sp. FL0890]|nr:hypothetical protein F5Y06DRAFT_168904 [Hypoxylon sp. FL0890]
MKRSSSRQLLPTIFGELVVVHRRLNTKIVLNFVHQGITPVSSTRPKMSATSSIPPNQPMGLYAYPMTERLCQCGTPLIAYFPPEEHHPYYYSPLPSPRPILYCPVCQARATRPPLFELAQSSAQQHPPAVQSPYYYHAWHQGAQDGYQGGHHTSHHLSQTRELPPLDYQQAVPYYDGGFLYYYVPVSAVRSDSSRTPNGTGMEHPRQQSQQYQYQTQQHQYQTQQHQYQTQNHQYQVQQHQYQTQQRPVTPHPSYNPNRRGYPERAHHEPHRALRHLPVNLPQAAHRSHDPSQAAFISSLRRPLMMTPQAERPTGAVNIFDGISDPYFWASTRAEYGSGSSRSSSRSSRIQNTPAYSPEIEDNPSQDNEERKEQKEGQDQQKKPTNHTNHAECTEHIEDSDDESSPLTFTENSETLLLSDEFAVPSRNAAVREAGPTTGFSEVTSLHESQDENGTPTTLKIKEDVHASDLTMSGGLS